MIIVPLTTLPVPGCAASAPTGLPQVQGVATPPGTLGHGFVLARGDRRQWRRMPISRERREQQRRSAASAGGAQEDSSPVTDAAPEQIAGTAEAM